MKIAVMPDEAMNILYSIETSNETEQIDLRDAVGRYISKDLKSPIPIPPFNRSPYDGYAVRSSDTKGASEEQPIKLKVIMSYAAGQSPTGPLNPGEAAKFMTGAPFPEGADTAVPFERLSSETSAYIEVPYELKAYENFARFGSDVPEGGLICLKGERLSPASLGLIASCGEDKAEVYKKPVAAVINTGSEVQMPGSPLSPAKIYNSSLYTLTGYLAQTGFEVIHLGVIEDEPNAIANAIKSAFIKADIVITTGGVSVGDFDFAGEAAGLAGAQMLFEKVSLKPGGANAAFKLGGKPLLCLSGNPGGALVFLLRCAMPLLKKMCGASECMPKQISCYLKTPFDKTSDRVRALRGRLVIENGAAYFEEYGPQDGGDISSLAQASLICEFPPSSPPVDAGALISAFLV